MFRKVILLILTVFAFSLTQCTKEKTITGPTIYDVDTLVTVDTVVTTTYDTLIVIDTVFSVDTLPPSNGEYYLALQEELRGAWVDPEYGTILLYYPAIGDPDIIVTNTGTLEYTIELNAIGWDETWEVYGWLYGVFKVTFNGVTFTVTDITPAAVATASTMRTNRGQLTWPVR